MISLETICNMVAVSKQKFARRLKDRLNSLGCPYTEGAEDSWIIELVFKPGEPRICLLQWLLSKYDVMLGEMVESSQPAITSSRMDSRIQRLLFVASNLGLCRYDDVDLIRGMDAVNNASLVNKQAVFIDKLLDIVMIHDAAEDPMTKSMLSPGIVSDSCPMEEQIAADCRYMDTVAGLQLPNTMLTADVNLIPHDIKRLIQHKTDSTGDVPSLQKLKEQCSTVEKNLAKRMEAFRELEEVKGDQCPNRMHRASQSLELILGELSQLVLSFTYCYENEMLPWCDKSPQQFSQLGPAFKRVHGLTVEFSQMVDGLRQIHHSYQSLAKGVSHKLKPVENTHASLLAEVSQAAASSFQQCVDILETSVQNEHASLSTSLCSSTLRL